jgi:hypothetical protein
LIFRLSTRRQISLEELRIALAARRVAVGYGRVWRRPVRKGFGQSELISLRQRIRPVG